MCEADGCLRETRTGRGFGVSPSLERLTCLSSGIPNKGLNQIRRLAYRGSRDLRLLSFTVFCVSFGWGAYFSTFNNFAVETLNLRADQLGMLESLREVPGFLMVFVAALMMRVAEPILGAIALGLVALGICGYSTVNSVPTLIVFSLVWSVGIHGWMPLSPSMTLSLAAEGRQGRRLGQMGSIGALGTICGMAMVFILAKVLHFSSIFVISGTVVGIGAVAVSMISRDIGHKQKPRFVFRKRFSLYYLLVFLEGCRKQVFITFAIFVLVRQFGASLRTVALLMIVNSVTNLILAPRFGRLIDRIGEKKVLLVCYSLLIPVFIGYATVNSTLVMNALHGIDAMFAMDLTSWILRYYTAGELTLGALCCLYFADNLLFLGSIGLTTYLHKIADPSDVMPSLAMGISVNHAAAVIVPVVGGLLWTRLGYQVTFYGGAGIVALSVLAVCRMRISARRVISESPPPS